MQMDTDVRRWLPTFGTPMLVAALASLIAWALQALGIVALPKDIATAVTPLVALIVHAIVTKPSPSPSPDAVPGPSPAPAPSAAIADYMADIIRQDIAAHPETLSVLVNALLARIGNPNASPEPAPVPEPPVGPPLA